MRISLLKVFLVSSASLTALSAQAQFGAIALDNNTFAYGFRVGAPSARDAQQSALTWCRQTGAPNCQLLWTFDHACGTLAVSQNHKEAWYVHNLGSKADQVEKTQMDSVNACTRAGGIRCAPQVSMCSDDNSAYIVPNQTAVGSAVVAYAAAQKGQKIGDGQCWALADAALAAARAVRPGERGLDTYVFGQEVYRNFQPGDIIQFENVTLQSPNYTGNFPHHTAIIASANGNVLTIYEQNANNVQLVTSETIDIGMKKSGLIRVYRPIPQN